MSLHDVDYRGDMREAAMPATHDASSERKADGTTTITQKVDNKSGAYVTTKDALILVNDGTNNRIGIGLLPDGQFNIIITKPGINITDAFA